MAGGRYITVLWRRKILRGWPVLVCFTVVAGTALGILALGPLTPNVTARGQVQFCAGSLALGCQPFQTSGGVLVEFHGAGFPWRTYRTTTAANGDFSITLPSGSYLVTYSGCRTYPVWPNKVVNITRDWYQSRLIDSNGVCELGAIGL